MSRLLLLATMFGGFALIGSAADDKKPSDKVVISDPAKLKDDPDYPIQGEYVGASGDGTKWGAQVIARGSGKFDVRFLAGGLPGDGWDGKTAMPATAAVNGGRVEVKEKDKLVATIADGVMTHASPTGFPLKKVDRKSPTLGLKPPEGAIVLFAGPKDVDRWQGGKLLTLSDGAFLAANNVRSHEAFHSFTAHIEFRLAYMPSHTGQARSNSGVYVQDRYEVQVLDSFGLKGVDNECGGIYKESAPKVNMCLPPMVWQTYDIEFTAAKFDADGKKTEPAVITVKHNGVTIHDKLKLKANTPGGKFTKEVPEPGSLFFQNHGDPVVFNNVWAVHSK